MIKFCKMYKKVSRTEYLILLLTLSSREKKLMIIQNLANRLPPHNFQLIDFRLFNVQDPILEVYTIPPIH